MAGKKENLEVFSMTDGDDSVVAGGLNEGPEFEENPEEEIEFVDHVELDDEPEPEVELDGDPEPEVEQETDAEDAPVEPEPEPEPKVDPAEERFNNMVAMIAKKDDQLESLVDQVKVLTEKIIQPAEVIEPTEPKVAPTPPDPEEMEWNEYTDAKIQYFEDLKTYNADVQKSKDDIVKAETEAAQAKELSNIQAIHAKDYAEEAEELPILKENETVRNKWAEIYYSPENAFNTKVDGVLRATRALKALARKDGVDLLTFGKKPESPKEPIIDPEKLKADEASRLKRVDAGAMTGSNKSPGTETKLTADHIQAAEKFGVSPESYLKTFKALGGKL